ncbi:hypothetical protein Gohar_018450, partial [Gossypium harknessii]|nr:hypothetical protein [Gossypium harknessii]
MKQLEEVDRINDLKKCFVLKDKIIQFYEEGKIEFEEKVASSNLKPATMVSQFNMMDRTIKFGSLDPITPIPRTRKIADFQRTGGNCLFLGYQNDHDWA